MFLQSGLAGRKAWGFLASSGIACVQASWRRPSARRSRSSTSRRPPAALGCPQSCCCPAPRGWTRRPTASSWRSWPPCLWQTSRSSRWGLPLGRCASWGLPGVPPLLLALYLPVHSGGLPLHLAAAGRQPPHVGRGGAAHCGGGAQPVTRIRIGPAPLFVGSSLSCLTHTRILGTVSHFLGMAAFPACLLVALSPPVCPQFATCLPVPFLMSCWMAAHLHLLPAAVSGQAISHDVQRMASVCCVSAGRSESKLV